MAQSKAERAAKQRARYLKLAYNLSVEQYDRMFALQDGRCAICKRIGMNTQFPDKLAVDHKSGTKEVRGLLCANCNLAIGLLQDSPTLLESAASYLEQACLSHDQ